MTTLPDPPYRYVSTPSELAHVTACLRRAHIVGLDTEGDSLHNYFEKVCLIQLCIDEANYIVDPLVRLDMAAFLEALSETELIIHGGDYDLRMLRHTFGFRPKKAVFDTVIGAQLIGHRAFGLAALVKLYAGVELTKHGQKADWSRRPIPDHLLRYASDDTRYLPILYEQISSELLKLHRGEWQRESCIRMVKISGEDRPRDPDRIWRVKGSGKLRPQALSYLRALWLWREEEARQSDRPAFKIMNNEQLLVMAVACTQDFNGTLPEAQKLCQKVRPECREACAHAVLDASRKSEVEWPKRLKGTRRPRMFDAAPLTEALKKESVRVASALNIESSILAPRATLSAIAQNRARTAAEMLSSSAIMPWQAKLLEHGFRRIIDEYGIVRSDH